MTRGSFSRSVARAAAAGGGKAYRARRPYAWYGVLALICVVGIGLIVYSRHERLHPVTEGPQAADHWKAALAVDLCGKLQPPLAANPTLATGLRTFGDGLIDIDPAAATTPANFEGKKATLGLFVKNYPGLTLTATSVKMPGKGQTLYANGAKCGKTVGQLQTKVWPSPTATGHLLSGNPGALHLTNGEMITVAFVPSGASIPKPSSAVRAALVTFLGGGSSASPSTSTSSTSTSSTSTTAPKATTTTSAKSKSTTTT
ncbi:MAG TPA: hypothetical protein VNF07_11625 [Acidimicrobiales bacterium]|nr:hypothetical protein [Acidimicrobiales bacterium]